MFSDFQRSFREIKQEMREAGWHYVSYYDRHGDTHICTYNCNGNTVECCGRTVQVPNDLPDLGAYEACRQACRIVRDERWDEYLGWSIY